MTSVSAMSIDEDDDLMLESYSPHTFNPTRLAAGMAYAPDNTTVEKTSIIFPAGPINGVDDGANLLATPRLPRQVVSSSASMSGKGLASHQMVLPLDSLERIRPHPNSPSSLLKGGSKAPRIKRMGKFTVREMGFVPSAVFHKPAMLIKMPKPDNSHNLLLPEPMRPIKFMEGRDLRATIVAATGRNEFHLLRRQGTTSTWERHDDWLDLSWNEFRANLSTGGGAVQRFYIEVPVPPDWDEKKALKYAARMADPRLHQVGTL